VRGRAAERQRVARSDATRKMPSYMHHTSVEIMEQVRDTGRLAITLDAGETAWCPRNDNAAGFRGPLLRVTYLLCPNGSVQANTAFSSCGTHSAMCQYEDDDGELFCSYAT
jgi:hypothetical protein